MLYKETNDTDPLEKMLGALAHSYKEAGIDIESYILDIKIVVGMGLQDELKIVYDSGIEKERSGLFEILKEAIGKERALIIIKEIQDILGVASPFGDPIFIPLNKEQKRYIFG